MNDRTMYDSSGSIVSFRIATLVGLVVIVVQGAYWIGVLSQRVTALESGSAAATADRYTKSDALADQKVFNEQLKHLNDDVVQLEKGQQEILGILRQAWVKP